MDDCIIMLSINGIIHLYDSDLECAVQDRDSYKYKVTELQRENQRLTEKIRSLAPTYDSSKKELDNIIDQRDRLASNLAELKTENSKLKVCDIVTKTTIL